MRHLKKDRVAITGERDLIYCGHYVTLDGHCGSFITHPYE